MKWSFANVGLIIFGFFGIFIITFFNELTVSNEQDYYTLKDAVEASMIDSVDTTYFRLTGSIKINQEKFVELLTRRFSEVATYGEGNYNLEFYQISESPPKVSVRVVDATNSYNIFGTFGTSPTQVDVVNEITAIMDVYEGGETDSRPIRTFFPTEIDFTPLVVGENPDNDIFEYDGNYYEIPDGTDVSDLDECELYVDRLECKNEEEVIIFEQVNEDDSCQENDGRIECKNPDGETIVIIPPGTEEEDDVVPPIIPEEETEPDDTPTEPDDTPVDTNKIIEVEFHDFKNIYSTSSSDLFTKYTFKLVPKFSVYMTSGGKTYLPINISTGKLIYDFQKPTNYECRKISNGIKCQQDGNDVYYVEVASYEYINSPLRCFKPVKVKDAWLSSPTTSNANKFYLAYAGTDYWDTAVTPLFNQSGFEGNFVGRVGTYYYKRYNPCFIKAWNGYYFTSVDGISWDDKFVRMSCSGQYQIISQSFSGKSNSIVGVSSYICDN